MDLLPILGIAVAVGFGSVLAILFFDRRRHRLPDGRVRCLACRHRYDPNVSLAAVAEWYCCEACEVADLERMVVVKK